MAEKDTSNKDKSTSSKDKEEGGFVRKTVRTVVKEFGLEEATIGGVILWLLGRGGTKGDGINSRTVADETLFRDILNLLKMMGRKGVSWSNCLEQLNKIAGDVDDAYAVDLRMSLLVGMGDNAQKVTEKLSALKEEVPKSESEREVWLGTTLHIPIDRVRHLMEKVTEQLRANNGDRDTALRAVVEQQIESGEWPGNLTATGKRKFQEFVGGIFRSEIFQQFRKRQREKVEALEKKEKEKPIISIKVIIGVAVFFILSLFALLVLTPEAPPRGRDLVQENIFYGQQKAKEIKSELDELVKKEVTK